VAGGDPARPDVILTTWRVRSLLAALRRWFPVVVLVVVALVVVTLWWDGAALIARIMAAVCAAVVLGFGAGVLIRDGRSPWRSSPRPLRRATAGGLLTLGAMVALLIAYAVTGAWILPVAALAAVPVLWFCGLAEMLGARVEPGFRYALRDLRAAVRSFRGQSCDWWRATRKELREVWTEPSEKSGRR
jgi:hypothetical protein